MTFAEATLGYVTKNENTFTSVVETIYYAMKDSECVVSYNEDGSDYFDASELRKKLSESNNCSEYHEILISKGGFQYYYSDDVTGCYNLEYSFVDVSGNAIEKSTFISNPVLSTTNGSVCINRYIGNDQFVLQFNKTDAPSIFDESKIKSYFTTANIGDKIILTWTDGDNTNKKEIELKSNEWTSGYLKGYDKDTLEYKTFNSDTIKFKEVDGGYIIKIGETEYSDFATICEKYSIVTFDLFKTGESEAKYSYMSSSFSEGYLVGRKDDDGTYSFSVKYYNKGNNYLLYDKIKKAYINNVISYCAEYYSISKYYSVYLSSIDGLYTTIKGNFITEFKSQLWTDGQVKYVDQNCAETSINVSYYYKYDESKYYIMYNGTMSEFETFCSGLNAIAGSLYNGSIPKNSVELVTFTSANIVAKFGEADMVESATYYINDSGEYILHTDFGYYKGSEMFTKRHKDKPSGGMSTISKNYCAFLTTETTYEGAADNYIAVFCNSWESGYINEYSNSGYKDTSKKSCYYMKDNKGNYFVSNDKLNVNNITNLTALTELLDSTGKVLAISVDITFNLNGALQTLLLIGYFHYFKKGVVNDITTGTATAINCWYNSKDTTNAIIFLLDTDNNICNILMEEELDKPKFSALGCDYDPVSNASVITNLSMATFKEENLSDSNVLKKFGKYNS